MMTRKRSKRTNQATLKAIILLIALFLVTVYDYFLPRNKDNLPELDNPHHADIENDRNELIEYGGGY